MNWQQVIGYRMRFDAHAGTGDIKVDHVEGNTQNTTTVSGLSAASFAAIAVLLTGTHRVMFNGTVFETGHTSRAQQ
ncbi:MAG TPA: hypothetical protein VJZ00_04205 [Thermoanaerobaculia bacterium]|nr:hypothetical protein [Thermoanaerobaculia bacterium]